MEGFAVRSSSFNCRKKILRFDLAGSLQKRFDQSTVHENVTEWSILLPCVHCRILILFDVVIHAIFFFYYSSVLRGADDPRINRSVFLFTVWMKVRNENQIIA